MAWSVQAANDLQKRGIPSVCVVTESWQEQAANLAENLGMGRGQVVVLPKDFSFWSDESIRAYAPEVLDDVAQGLTRKEQRITRASASSMDLAQMLEDPESAQELYLEKQWTDGLPIVPPTGERVREVMATVNRGPQDVVASLPPQWRPATIEKIAVNAVMAGCRPEYFPVVVAAVEAMADPAFDLIAHATCTSSSTPLFIVNGPVRQGINLESGYALFGSAAHANASIGRALRLVRRNIGGQIPGLTDMTTFGFPGGGQNLCIAENEELNPWEPLHVQRGFRPEDSTVTVAAVVTFQNMCHNRTTQPESQLAVIASGIAQMGYRDYHNSPLGVGNVLVMLAPAYAQWFSEAGYTRQDIQTFLRDKARVPLEELPPELVPHAEAGGRIDGRWVYSVERPDQIVIFVAGGYNGFRVGTEPAIVMHTNHQRWEFVTKKIAWDPSGSA